MSVTDEVLALVTGHRNNINTLTDDHAYRLARAWVTAWDQLGQDFTAALEELLTTADGDVISAAQVHKARRLQQALAQAEAAAGQLQAVTADTTTSLIPDLVALGTEHTEATVRAQLPAAPNLPAWVKLNPEAVDMIVARTTQQIHATSQPLTAYMVAAMKRELTHGIVVGDNPRTTAARIVRRLEGRFSGGLARAERIARTEMLDAYRTAEWETEKANREVVRGWVWMTTLDARTCISCLVQHGTEHSLDEFGPADHQNGRCTRVPLTRSWADLGFAGIEEPPNALPDAREWFDGLTEETQRRIMGPGRFQLYQDGAASWDDMTTRRTTPEWRDSWAVPSVAALTGRSTTK